MRHSRTTLAAAGVALLLAACGSATVAEVTAPLEVAVVPAAASLVTSASQTFRAAVSGTTNVSVTWSVREGAAGGTVTASGVYTAPSGTGEFHVVAASVVDGARTGTATVTVTALAPPPPPPTSACSAEPLRTTGTTSYVCDCQAGAQSGCVAGSDTNAGTSAAAPWQTWGKARVQFSNMAAGSTVAFCDGGSWTGVGQAPTILSANYMNTSCTAGTTCDMRNYPTSFGGGVRPKLRVGAGLSFMELGWYQKYPMSTYAIHGLRFFNLEIVGNSSDGLTTAEEGFKFWGGVTDVDLCNLEIHHGLASAINLVTNSTLARITLRDSSVHDNRGSNICVVCGAADDLTVIGNRFDLNGTATNRAHTIYYSTSPFEPQCGNGAPVISTYCKTSRLTYKNNTISRSAWGSGNRCMGVAVVGHDVFDGVTIEDNLISEPTGTADPGCYGISFSSGGEAAWVTNMVIRGNRMFNMGGNGVAVSGAPGAIIENNLIVGGPSMSVGIAYPEQPAGSKDLACADGRVRNNTIYLPIGGGGSYAINGINEGTGHQIANNAIVTGPSTSYCVQAPAGTTVATNLCSTTGTGWWAAPGLDATTASFRPAASSPLLGAGTAAYASPTDLAGVVRGDPPTAGAYEQ